MTSVKLITKYREVFSRFEENKNIINTLRNRISFLTMFSVNKRMAWPWDRLLDLLWQMFSCHFMKSNDQNSAQRNLNQFFTEDMLMTFLFSSNRLNTSRNFVITLILVIQTCLSPLNRRKMESCHLPQLIVVSKYVLIGPSFMKNLVFLK